METRRRPKYARIHIAQKHADETEDEVERISKMENFASDC